MEKRKFKFYKGNLVDGLYTLTIEEMKEKYREFIKSKDPQWVVYYGHHTVIAFITAPEGLGSTMDNLKELPLLEDELMKVRHELPIYKENKSQ